MVSPELSTGIFAVPLTPEKLNGNKKDGVNEESLVYLTNTFSKILGAEEQTTVILIESPLEQTVEGV
jgi:phenylpyruvate tautomerase PptA (4-oxalocrotonate tautomerase family)